MTWISPRGLRRRSIPKWSLASEDDELANNATKCWDGGNSSLGSSSNENVLLDKLYKNKLEMEASKQTVAELKLEVSCSSANPQLRVRREPVPTTQLPPKHPRTIDTEKLVSICYFILENYLRYLSCCPSLFG